MPVLLVTASLAVLAVGLAAACGSGQGEQSVPPADAGMGAARDRMVTGQIEERGVRDPRVLAAMRDVPRHLFVPEALRSQAYDDHPLHIGHGQTISQPYIVALMTELARPAQTDRALEVGTGSGYQAAVLSRLVAQVYTVEVNEALQEQAAERLARLGYGNVRAIHADGYAGWAPAAPYDVIIVTAAPEEVPEPLIAQLSPGGRLVIPVGGRWSQNLRVIEKDAADGLHERIAASVMFVPLVHRQ